MNLPIDVPLMALAGLLLGLSVGGLAVWFVIGRRTKAEHPLPEPTDEWLDAEIDLAAANWAAGRGNPEQAGIMADKLKLLPQLGRRKGWL